MIAHRNIYVTLPAQPAGKHPEAQRPQSGIAQSRLRSNSLAPLFDRSAALPRRPLQDWPQGNTPKPSGRKAASRTANPDAIPSLSLQDRPQGNPPALLLSRAGALSRSISLFDRSAALPRLPLQDWPQGNTPRLKAFRSGAAPRRSPAATLGRAPFSPAASSLRGTQGCPSARGERGPALCQPAGDHRKQAHFEALP